MIVGYIMLKKSKGGHRETENYLEVCHRWKWWKKKERLDSRYF